MHFYYAIKRRGDFLSLQTSLLHVRRFFNETLCIVFGIKVFLICSTKETYERKRDTLLHCISARTRCHLWLHTADAFLCQCASLSTEKNSNQFLFFLHWQFSMHHKAIWCCAIIFRAQRSQPLVWFFCFVFSLMHIMRRNDGKNGLNGYETALPPVSSEVFLSIFEAKFAKKC